MVEGTAVRPGLSPQVIGSIASSAAVATVALVVLQGGDSPLTLIALCFCAVVVVWSVRKIRRGDDAPRAIATTWLVHPRGVVIRGRDTQRHIPVEAIAAIDGADSIVGSMTQVSIRVRLVSSQTLSWRPILYLHGSSDDRRSQLFRMRQTLSL